MADSKPYHLMTPAERLAQRIAQNRQIEEKVQKSVPAVQASKVSKKNNGAVRDPRTTARSNEPSGTGTRVEVTESFSIRKVGRG